MAITMPLEQMLQESDEFSAAFAVCQQEGDTTGQSIERTEDGGTTVLARRWNNAVLADEAPHATQAGIEMELAFVLEEEGVMAGRGCHFFKAAFRSRLARRTSFGSCLCLRDNFGRL